MQSVAYVVWILCELIYSNLYGSFMVVEFIVEDNFAEWTSRRKPFRWWTLCRMHISLKWLFADGFLCRLDLRCVLVRFYMQEEYRARTSHSHTQRDSRTRTSRPVDEMQTNTQFLPLILSCSTGGMLLTIKIRSKLWSSIRMIRQHTFHRNI